MKIADPDGARAAAPMGWKERFLIGLRQRMARLRRPALAVRAIRRPRSDSWGYDRGTPVDRYYIRRFLDAHRDDIRGDTLEVRDMAYSRRFGAGVRERSVVDIDAGNPEATVTADLGEPASLPECRYDCFILTQTLHLVPRLEVALDNARRCLVPGGVLLATLPAVSRIVSSPGIEGDFWRFTPEGARLLFSRTFGDGVEVEAYGSLPTTIAFLAGVASEELSSRTLARRDARYPLLVCVRAVKGS